MGSAGRGQIDKWDCAYLVYFRQITGGPINGILILISAGFTRPYVSDTVVRKMLRIFRLDQIRTTLRTLTG